MEAVCQQWNGVISEVVPLLQRIGVEKINVSPINFNLSWAANGKTIVVEKTNWIVLRPNGAVDIVPADKIKFN